MRAQGLRAGALAAAAAAVLWPTAAMAERDGWWGRAQAVMSGLPGQGRVTQREAEQGLKEGMAAAARATGARLGAVDGFAGDADLRIPLPRSLAAMEPRLAAFGLAGPLQTLERNLNRAAEAAAPALERLLVEAIQSITIDDGLGVLRGGEDAATQYLRQRTRPALAKDLRPHLEASLEGAGAFSALDELKDSMPLRGLAGDLRADLVDYVLEKTVDGAFHTLAEEEAALRRDPARWTTALLARVYGAQ